MVLIISTDVLGALLATVGALTSAIGLTFFVRRSMVKGNPLDAAMVTLLVNVLIYVPLSILLYSPHFGLTLRSFLAFGAAGLLASFLVRILVYAGTKRIGISRVNPVLRADLLIASVVALVVLAEPASAGHLTGIVLLSIGVVMVSREIESHNNTEFRLKPSFDLLIPLGAMFFSGLARPVAKAGLLEGTPVVVGLAVKFAVALIALNIYFLWKGMSPIEPFRADERKLYMGAGIFSSITMGLFYLSLDISRVVVMMPFRSLSPLFVVVLSYVFLQRLEKVTRLLVMGSILVVSGTALVGMNL